jgi:hypothetical protein
VLDLADYTGQPEPSRSADIACQAVPCANFSALREPDSPLLRIADDKIITGLGAVVTRFAGGLPVVTEHE